MAFAFTQIIPTFRIFDVDKAREFYVGFLGFQVDWEHQFEDNLPKFLQVSRDGLTFYLSEHHGDGSPGANCTVWMTGLNEFHAEITAKNYRFMRPGIETMPWSARSMGVIDPFSNQIHFSERLPKDP